MSKFANLIKPTMFLSAALLAAFVAGCGGGGSSGPATPLGASSGPTGAACAGASCVSLGTAGNYAVLAKTGVSTVPTSVVTGHVGVSPVARIGLTGWSLIGEPTDTSFTSAQVAAGGFLYAADNVGGTTSVDLTTAIGDMQTAYTAAAGKPAGVGVTNLERGAGTLTSDTLVPGTYTWAGAVNIPTDLTFNGSATDVWILQIGGTLDMAAAKNVIMTGGAKAKNVFWQVADAVTIGANTHFEGVILAQTGITFGNLSSLNGRMLAQSAVVLDATTVTVPQ
jgi:hypothetical protein